MLVSIPDSLLKWTKDCKWTRITIGFSGAGTFLLSGNSNTLYLKTQHKTFKESLRQEQERMLWLHGKLPIPEVLYYGEDEANEYLLTTEISGADASSRTFERMLPERMRQLALGLRAIHQIPIHDCPFDQRLNVKLEEAARRVREGFVDEADFDESRKGATAADLLEQLLSDKPSSEDLVFTHGDYCLPNIILKDGKVNGFVDWGRAGVADRYQDLALAVRSIIYNFGQEHVESFLNAYGLATPDDSKTRYYQLLDEFF